MRVIHVAPTAFGDGGLYGGGERYPLELCRALARRIECRLITFGASSARTLEPGGLERIVLRPAMLLRGHPAHPVSAQLLAAVAGAPLLHAHHMRSAPSRMAAVVSRLSGGRRVVTDHGLGGGGWWGLLPRLFDRFACVSRYSADTLGAPAAKTRVVYGGVDPDVYRPDASETRAGALFVGRLTPHKGIDVLLRALPPEAQLSVVGTGGHDRRGPEIDYPNLLCRLARGRDVAFRGPVSEEELVRAYRRAAVFVLPSVDLTCYGRRVGISELLGLSLLEAMATATPVVCSRIGGLPEVVSDGETGFLVEPGDEAQLSDRIATLLGDRRLARRMGEAGRERVLETFTWDRCAERCLAVYEELGAL